MVSRTPLRIALIGDYSPAVIAHRAIPPALALAATAEGCVVDGIWSPTEAVAGWAADDFESYDGFWCVPASPYRDPEGALRAIRFARIQLRPFLGTCGGFQHALLEYARNVLGLENADHAESNPAADLPLITPLSCGLVEQSAAIVFEPGSKMEKLYGSRRAVEDYHCRYGLNPAFSNAVAASEMRITGRDEAGDVRAVELDGHPFFVATLFQPERSGLRNVLHPLIRGFVAACATAAASSTSTVRSISPAHP